MTTYRMNEAHRGVEVIFDAKPQKSTLDELKGAGFKWHRGGGYWYARATEEAMQLARKICGSAEDHAAADHLAEYFTTTAPGYMGATQYTGSKYAEGRSLYGAELSKAVREALKGCGVSGVSVRVKTYSGGQSLRFTVKAAAAEIISEADYIAAELAAPYSNRIWYTDENGQQIHRDALPFDDFGKCQTIRTATARAAYRARLSEMRGEWGSDWHNMRDMAAPSLAERIKAIQRIADAFNHDNSNGMVDYFDRHFYEDIAIKAA